jgi:hypothetical protein
MAYGGGSRLPFESASKIAHMELIRDPALNDLIQNFKSDQPSTLPLGATKSGTLGLERPTDVHFIITVDGGLTIVPNPVRRDKAVAFVQVGAMVIHMDDIRRIASDPMMDPRDLQSFLKRVDRYAAVMPLSGVRIPNLTIKQTNRVILNAILSPPWTNLYGILEYLLWRDWLPPAAARPPRTMHCYECRELFPLVRGRTFACPHCGHEHYLSDYLDLFSEVSEEWGTEQIASMIMNTLETLALWKLPVRLAQANKLDRLTQFLLIKDGPLLFRAQGFRLVDSIRDFIEWLSERGHQINLVGIEKSGDFAEFLKCFPTLLQDTGDFFIPSVRFIQEDVRGGVFNPATFRNRVSYGSRVGIRVSDQHVLCLHIPTQVMTDTEPTSPTAAHLLNFETVAATLSGLTSSAHENAVLPLVLANRAVSLSENPSARILDEYITGLIGPRA